MKVSVALCTYNGEKYLIQQLESILKQSRPLDEIVICDDKSTDGTVEIIENFLKKDPGRLRFFKNIRNIGAIKSFERCIGECSGDIIFLSDQDDVWYGNKVSRVLDVFRNDRKALLVFSDGDLIDENGSNVPGTLWSKWNFTERLQKEWRNNNHAFKYLAKNQNKITGATVAFRKELKDAIFPFELPLNMWHDTWLGLIAAGNKGLRFIADPLIQYRVHGNQQIGIGNGISMVTGDKSYDTVPYEYFQQKIVNIFPRKKKLLCPSKPSLIQSVLDGVKRILNRFVLKHIK